MSDRLRGALTLERQQLHRLLESYQPLLKRCAEAPPSDLELTALAAVLHSFYNGIENIFKRITQALDGQSPRGEFWHRQLLESMRKPGTARPAVLSEELAIRLDDYLQFRHLFRHSYAFDLDWESMKPLVLGCNETLQEFEAELDQFLNAMRGH